MTAAEEQRMRHLAATQEVDRFSRFNQGVVENAAVEATKLDATKSATDRILRRRIINWLVHGLIALGAPESAGMTLAIGAMFDLFLRLPITLLGPLVGIEGGWADMFTIKFIDGDLFDKVDAILIFCEIMAAIILFTSLMSVVAIIYQGMINDPAFVVFKNLI